MVLTANWRNEIRERWGIHLLSQYGPLVGEALWVTRCSRTKSGVHCGTPKELYVSSANRYFYRCMEKEDLRYGVLSDKYGLHFDDEELPYYDVHPRDLSRHDKEWLGQMIRDKALRRGFTQVIFYSQSPLMSVPYFEMLYYSGLDIFYTTALSLGSDTTRLIRCQFPQCIPNQTIPPSPTSGALAALRPESQGEAGCAPMMARRRS